jgi:hypothetical protein
LVIDLSRQVTTISLCHLLLGSFNPRPDLLLSKLLKMKHLLLFGLILILTACGTPEVSTPAPAPDAVNIIYPQSLQPWADKLVSCASKVHQITIYIKQSDSLDTDIRPNDIVLEFGNPDNTSDVTFLSQVGWEQIVVIVNKENPLSTLSNNELKSIFTGQGSKVENGSTQSTQVWVLPEGEPTRAIFDHTVMQEKSLTTEGRLAPSPGAMLEAISQNSSAIGYLPGSFLYAKSLSDSSKVKIVLLDPSLDAQLRQPVIAITRSEPSGLLRNLLVCLDINAP